jgi:hypothetical protein
MYLIYHVIAVTHTIERGIILHQQKYPSSNSNINVGI